MRTGEEEREEEGLGRGTHVASPPVGGGLTRTNITPQTPAMRTTNKNTATFKSTSNAARLGEQSPFFPLPP